MSKHTHELNLPLQLDRNAPASLQRQLADQIRRAISSGQLAPGARLPSTRALARSLRISRNIVCLAYDDLFAEGYLAGRRGSGTYVERALPDQRPSRAPASPAAHRWLSRPLPPLPVADTPAAGVINFRLGVPATASLSAAAWRRAWRSVGAAALPNDYLAPGGDRALREAIAGYLGRSRGIACSFEDIVITAGTGQALDLIARATLAPGDCAALEDPGYLAARQILHARGAQILPAPVDDDGVQVERLPRGAQAPLLVYLTPSHQYPLGVRLSAGRRLALIAWAAANDSLLIEDDYDSEFRFDVPPLPALAGLDTTGHVAYIGTFSKVLAPALRVGYLVAPPALRARIAMIKRLGGDHTPWPVQRALAAFIAEGHFDRHIRTMRQIYAQKRAILRDALAPLAPLAQLRGLDAGLHAFLEFGPDLDPDQVAAQACGRGVIVTSLAPYYLGAAERRGLLLGYGGLGPLAIVRGAAALVEVIGAAACDATK